MMCYHTASNIKTEKDEYLALIEKYKFIEAIKVRSKYCSRLTEKYNNRPFVARGRYGKKNIGALIEKNIISPLGIVSRPPLWQKSSLKLNLKQASQGIFGWKRAKRIENLLFESEKLIDCQVRGKNLAIIGPNFEPDELNNLANKFHTIVFFNSRKKPSNLKRNNVITYFNNKHFREAEGAVMEAAKHNQSVVLWAPFKKKYTEKQLWNIANSGMSLAADIKELYFTGFPNALPTALIDLLLFKPKSIVLYGFDFFCGENYASAEYLENNTVHKDLVKKYKSVAGHDPIANWLLIKKIWRRNAFICDEYTHRYLSLDEEEFAGKLERKYSELFNPENSARRQIV